jgi:hypothetical protein
MEQLAVGSKNIFGVGIAVSDLCINRRLAVGEEVSLGSWSFVQRAFHMA